MKKIKKVFQQLEIFLKDYKLFELVIITAIAAAVLEILKLAVAAHILIGAVCAVTIVPLLIDMWREFRHGTYGLDILAATSIIASVLLGQFWAGLVIAAMLSGGEALEDYAGHRAKRELSALLKRAPQKAHLLTEQETVDVRVKDVEINSKILIKPGEIVPIDAVILEGEASFDESSITGESEYKICIEGDTILSGSVNLDGAVTARTLRSAQDSQYEQIIKLVQSASASQTPFIRMADRYSIPFTAIAYGIAISVWIISGQAIRFLEVIIVATPCPLILAAPTALMSGVSVASRFGIVVKTGVALEKVAQAKTFAFDKTGTLTKGDIEVEKVTVFEPFTQERVLSLAASLESSSTHVLAKAIINAAKELKLQLSKAYDVKETPGHGLQATIEGVTILVGRSKFMEDNGVEISPEFHESKNLQTTTYVAVNNKVAGIINFKDAIRPEAQSTIARLHALGVKHILMITGDNQSTAKDVAEKIGIDHVIANALPPDKMLAIEHVKERPVVFVGDGVNDAPVLTAADVGVALGARGSTAASESAGIVIMHDDLARLAQLLVIAKNTFKIAKQSILIGIFISLGLMVIFATGRFTPLFGAVLQEAVDVFVIFNALRAHSVKAL